MSQVDVARSRPAGAIPTAMSVAEVQGRVYQLVNAYRVRGHLFAHVDPLRLEPPLRLSSSSRTSA